MFNTRCKLAFKQDLPVQELFPEYKSKVRREISTFLLICKLKRFPWGVVSQLTRASPTQPYHLKVQCHPAQALLFSPCGLC